MSTATPRFGGLLHRLRLLGDGDHRWRSTWFRAAGVAAPMPGQQRCVATAGGRSVALDLDQAHYTSIIVGVSVRRGLPARAATIAMATVYQETDIRNLDYGDRDSVGLFQQRPSQGWGTEEQIMDPYYSTGKFYDALVKIDGWRRGDITEMAQRVQRERVPRRVPRSRGRRPGAGQRLHRATPPPGSPVWNGAGEPGDAAGLRSALTKTLGTSQDRHDRQHRCWSTAASAKQAWAYATFAVANSGRYGTVQVVVGDRVLDIDGGDARGVGRRGRRGRQGPGQDRP